MYADQLVEGEELEEMAQGDIKESLREWGGKAGCSAKAEKATAGFGTVDPRISDPSHIRPLE